jgi:hypothetical protein
LEVLPYRSIQIGIGKSLSGKWVKEWIDGIEDVTEWAEKLRDAVKGEAKANLGVEELVRRGLLPLEREYVLLGEEVSMGIGMDMEREDKKGEDMSDG